MEVKRICLELDLGDRESAAMLVYELQNGYSVDAYLLDGSVVRVCDSSSGTLASEYYRSYLNSLINKVRDAYEKVRKRRSLLEELKHIQASVSISDLGVPELW